MKLLLAILTALVFALGPATAAVQAAEAGVSGASAAVRDGPVAARLVSEELSVQPGRPFTVALVLSMDPDWHVYWKYPGDSGLPTAVTWDLPPGFSAGPLQWPVPERFISQGLVTYGYSGRVLLLTEISVPPGAKKGAAAAIRASAGWLACRVECTPGKAQLSLSLPVSAGAPAREAAWSQAFEQARSRLAAAPAPGAFSASADADSVTLVSAPGLLPKGVQASFYPGSARGGEPLYAAAVVLEQGLPESSDTEGAGCESPRTAGRASSHCGARCSWDAGGERPRGSFPCRGGLLAAILLAFVGGLILNLMPCVLPVISLKALTLLRQGGHGVRHGLLFTLGVLVSFWIIAAVLESFRAGGRLLGWGFQFQDPVVVIVTAVLFFLVGLNLFGVFEVGSIFTRLGGRLGGGPNATPGTVHGAEGGGPNATSGGGPNATSGGGTSSFASGVFAAAVATPCTAPFMGAAVGYALTHSPAASLGVFTALGLGMAAPSLALAVAPGLSSRLPKPGPWMETFRQVMAFPMMAAAVWMVSVLASLSGAAGAVVLLSAMLAAGLGAWVWGRWGTLSRRTGTRVIAGALALLLVVGATAAAAGFLPRAADPALAQNVSLPLGSWEPWSAPRVEELRRAGTPVFVDFTAKWCLTCLVNEKVALDRPEVRTRFRQAGVAMLRADWTDSSDEISRGLAAFGRAGVPLYVYYPADGNDPVILPQILTPGVILAAIH